MRRFWVPIVATFVLTVTACGDQPGTTQAAQSTPSAAAPTTSAAPAVSPTQPGVTAGPVIPPGKCDIAVSKTVGHKPTVTFPKTCTAPRSLVSRDIAVGTGQVLKVGQTATVQYVGISLSTRKQFDASWDRNQPFPVQNVGQARVIDGWNQGLPGMHVGGRRLLIIPPDLGYGASGSGPIGPNETLVFVIDLVSINAPGR
ncbi:MAG TPA: FKBP-type peptidyl-prolyl cis-trans isomerase [Mycobacteriales bacterium]|nr:FKBP-type peptidyl-prolyl cis-trans isomerase [Mycobacteriales bacterium]